MAVAMNARQNILAAFSEEQAERLSGITKAQLRYWVRTDFFRPSYIEANPRVAFSRVYSFKDVVSLRVLNVLRNQFRLSLQYLREVSKKLKKLDENPDHWIGTKLYPLNGRVVWYETGTELPQEVTSGQYVSSVVLDEVVQKTKEAVQRLHEPRSSQTFGRIEKSRFVMHNAPVIAGTRIPVTAIKRFSEAGYSVAQIREEYPDLTEQDILAALEYREASTAA
jgi:uncharacterized protein (DUF433 family)